MKFNKISDDQWDSDCENYSILSYLTGAGLEEFYMPYKKEKKGKK